MKRAIGMVAALLLSLSAPRGWADEPAKKASGHEGGSMPCCVDKKDCCKDMKPCCSMKEGSWGKEGDHKDGEHKDGDHKGGYGEGDKGGPGDRLAQKLGLSEDQKAKLKTLHEKNAESGKALHEAMHASLKALKEGVDKKASDADLSKLITGVEKARDALRAQEDKNIQEMKKILTVPQQAKAALMFAKKAEMMKEGMRHRREDREDRRERREERRDRREKDDDDDEGHEGHEDMGK